MCYLHLRMGLRRIRDSFPKKAYIIIYQYSIIRKKTKILIPHLSNDVPSKYLGVHTSPNGCKTKQSDVTFKTAQDGARDLASKPFTLFQYSLYLNRHLNMKLYFSLTTSSLPETQYIKTNKTHIPQALSFTRV